MKVLALTDIHGAYDKACDIIRHIGPDVVIIGGDLTTIGTVREAEDALSRFKALVPALFCVAGNMDLPQHDNLFERLEISLNGKGVIVEDTGFCGVSAAPISPLNTPYEISEDEIALRLERGYNQIRHCRRRIVVPHAPPYGTRVDIIHSGIHVGSIAVRDFVEEESPDVVICGHIHEARGQDVIGQTRIVNCGQASKGFFAFLQINDEIIVETRQLSD